MKRSVRRFVLGLLCLVFLSALVTAQQVSLTILHTNDTHSHLLPFSYPASASPGSTLASLRVRKDIGGIARRATLVKQLQEELGKRGTAVWLVDAGDFYEGTPFSTEYRGEADVAAMNAMGYMFGTIGNHELNLPLAQLKKLIGLANFHLLCANLTENATGRPLVPPSEIRKVGPLTIGIFGLTTPEAAAYPAAKDGLTIGNEIETARRLADTLRREAGIVILISHAGDDVDKQIAAKVPGIDVIIGGHSHTRLPVGELVRHSGVLEKSSVNGTVIVQAYQWGGELGRLDLLFDKDEQGVWHVDRRYHERLIPITSKYAEDAKVAAVVDGYWKPIAAHYAEVVGKAAADFVEESELANYNLVSDAVRETYGTDIELENLGGVRAPIIKGNITLAELIELDPFGNTVVTFKITGLQLKQILLKHRPAVSGLRYRIEGGQLAEATVAGKPLDDNTVYSGATNSYLAGAWLKGIEFVDLKKTRLGVIIDYIRKKGVVRPLLDGRRRILN